MRNFLICLSLPLILAACAQTGAGPAGPDDSYCARADSPICAFLNAPLRLSGGEVHLPRRPYPFQPLAEELRFVDRGGRLWIAPQGILTDGASIPPALVRVVGQPRDPSFAKAAAIHDSYCGVGNEDAPYYHTRSWKETHRMFYEALRVGGTPDMVAKTMFAAVYMGGPRWSMTRRDPVADPVVTGDRAVVSSRLARATVDNPQLGHIPVDVLQARLARLVARIASEGLSLAEIEAQVDGEIDALQVEFPTSISDSLSGFVAEELGRARDPIGGSGVVEPAVSTSLPAF